MAATTALLLLAGCGSATQTSVDSVDIDGIGTVSKSTDLEDSVPDSLTRTGLRVVTAAPYPPFEQFRDGNVLEGVDIDLARAIGAKLGVAMTVESVDFSGLVPAIQAGRYDIAMASMEDTVERQNVFNFVDYSSAGAVLVVPSENPENIAGIVDLCGSTVGTELGTTFEVVVTSRQQLCEEAGKPPIAISLYPTQAAGLLALQSGSVSALVSQKTSATLLVNEQADKFALIQDPDAPKGYPTRPGTPLSYSGIAIPKQSGALFESVYQAMVELGQDGITQKIFEKWGIGDVAVNPPLQNQGGA